MVNGGGCMNMESRDQYWCKYSGTMAKLSEFMYRRDLPILYPLKTPEKQR